MTEKKESSMQHAKRQQALINLKNSDTTKGSLKVLKNAQDGLTNVITGLGTKGSKRSNNTWELESLNSYVELDACYQSSWLARRVNNIYPEHATRNWREIKCNDADKIERMETQLGVKENVLLAAMWSRLYGGSVILMITDQDLSKPLNVNKIKKGSLKRLIVLDRWMLSATYINVFDVLSDSFLKPDKFIIQGGASGIGEIHHSHFVKFTGEPLSIRYLSQTQGWGDSFLRQCIETITDYVASNAGIAELLEEANVDVVTRDGLSDELGTDEEDAIINRYALFRQMKSVFKMALLDGEEKYDRKTLQLSGVSNALEEMRIQVAGCAKAPMTLIFGTSAKGLNATGEGDLKTFYNDVKAYQEAQLSPALKALDEVLVRSAIGRMPKDFNYIWLPLEQPNMLEKTQAELYTAQKDAVYLNAGVTQRSQIQRNLQATEQYQFENADIEELEKLESANISLEPVNQDDIDAEKELENE